MFLCRLWLWAVSQEAWKFLHDIYDGGPVLFYGGEKGNEEEKQDLKDEEEDIQRGWNSWQVILRTLLGYKIK